MTDWKKYRLSEFIDFNPTISLKKGTVARKITMDRLIPHSRDIYDWVYEPYSGGAKFQNGDTIMARITPCLENGKHAFVSLLDEGEVAYGSTEYIVMRGKPGISDNRFVYYLSHYPDFKSAAIKSMVGSSGRQRAQVDVLKNLEFYLPGLEEQFLIAETLSALDDKIAINNRISHNLEEQAKALFKSWFVDFDPFQDRVFVDSEIGIIPKGWIIGSLKDIAVITMGTSPSGKSYNTNGVGDVFYQGRAEFGNRFPSRNLFTTEAKRFAEENSVLLSVRAPVGDINVAEERCCIGRGLASIQSLFGTSSYLLYCMHSLQPELNKFNGEGTVFGSINKKDLEGLRVLIPPRTIMQEFDALVSKFDMQILEFVRESRTLKTLRDTLLPKLMSGEIAV